MLVGRLTGEQVAFVAVRGIDEGRVNDSIAAARQAGATVTRRPVDRIEVGTGGDDAKALATAVGDPSLRGAKLRAAAWAAARDAAGPTAARARDRPRIR